MTASSSFSSPRTADWHPPQQPWAVMPTGQVIPLPPHLASQLPPQPPSPSMPFGPGGPIFRIGPPPPVVHELHARADSPLKAGFSEHSKSTGPPPGLMRACAMLLSQADRTAHGHLPFYASPLGQPTMTMPGPPGLVHPSGNPWPWRSA